MLLDNNVKKTTNDGQEYPDSRKTSNSTRHSAPDDGDDVNRSRPRLGRRESEPHSAEITHIYDVLSTNFPNDRVMWDLHHYFYIEGIKHDIQFDISFFKDFKLDKDLPSYDASKFNGKKPDLAINILSRSTWRNDIGLHVDICRVVGIPIYMIFLPYPVKGFPFQPPFLRIYFLKDNGDYHVKELKALSIDRSGELITSNFIDLAPTLSLKVGLVEKNRKYFPNHSEYRIIFMDTKTKKILKNQIEKVRDEVALSTKLLKEKDEALKEKDEALKEKVEALKEKVEALKEKDEALKEKESIIKSLKSKIDALEKS
ncbi:MAG: hypothetical protein ACTSVI_00605 [Promethearchaeota archaeon]